MVQKKSSLSKQSSLITVITVAYNERDSIATTISSFLGQDYQNKELIIVDGCSSDGTREYVEEVAKLHSNIRFVSEVDEGIYDAMNKGFGLAVGEFFGYLNCGDEYEDSACLSSLAAWGSYDVISCAVVFQNKEGETYRTWIPKPFNSFSLRFGWSVPHPGLYIRKSIFNGRLPFNKEFKLSADYDLICDLATRQLNWKFSERITVRMSYGGATTNGFQSSFLNLLQLARVRLKRFGLLSCVFGVFGNYLLKIWQLNTKKRGRDHSGCK